MLQARNRMSHTYDAASALVIHDQLPGFLVSLEQWFEHIGREARQDRGGLSPSA
jgi:hypothetical protein